MRARRPASRIHPRAEARTSPMRPLYIHVGQPKTGTSSIQRFLVDHRAALLAAGLGLGPYMTLPTGKSRPLREAIRTRGLAATMDALAASPG